MGMYTGLRFKAELKPLVADAIRLVYCADDFWESLSRILPISDRWLNVGRRSFIPFGSVNSMPEDWELLGSVYPIENTWKVCCSLKNYEGEIECFLREVLPYFISEPCRVEYRYEEWETSRFDIIMPEEFEEEGSEC